MSPASSVFFFFFNDPATTEIYTLSLHDALPILAIGYIAITSRSRGPASCVKTVDWAIRHKDHILGIDLADSERDFPLKEFVPSIRKAREAGLKVTIHTGEDTPASFVVEAINLAQ